MLEPPNQLEVPHSQWLQCEGSLELCWGHIATSMAESTPAVTTEHTRTWGPSHTLQPTPPLCETHSVSHLSSNVPRELCAHLAQPGATTSAINGSLHIMGCGPWVPQPLRRCPWGLSLCPWISTTGKGVFLCLHPHLLPGISGVPAFKCRALVYSYLQCLFPLSQQCKSRLIPLKFMELRQCKTD